MPPKAPKSPKTTPKSSDRLGHYREKRSASHTPEPFGDGPTQQRVTSKKGGIFVVQKHAASTLHWDLRLESDGVLLSWAVPKGPSPNPTDKRLAIHVEDHPLDYAEFEGIIPKKQYGAGPVIVWDKGVCIPLEDLRSGIEKGKLLFELRGHKLRGRWTLVKTKQSETSWLLIKERDSFVSTAGTDHYPDDSIYSGLKVEELGSEAARAEEIRRKLVKLGATWRSVLTHEVKLMLATAIDEPFSKAGWIFEIKYDGYRILAGRNAGASVLLSRTGGDFTATFPEVARAIRGLPYDGLVLDGEVVVHNRQGLPDFGALQKRGRLTQPAEIGRAVFELPATLYAFDLLGFAGYDLRKLPLLKRKEILKEILPSIGPIRFTEHIERRGKEMYGQMSAMGLEGIVAKKADSPYRGGRSKEWLKIRVTRTDDFVIVGWTEPQGSRPGFGALHLAQYGGDDRLVYRGSVGTGFSDKLLTQLHGKLLRVEVARKPFPGEVPAARRPRRHHHWAKPVLVCEAGYTEITEQGLLRHPAFVRLRDDKKPEECRVQEIPAAPEKVPAEEESMSAKKAKNLSPHRKASDELSLTNLDKIYWPKHKYTKGDLIQYYRSVSKWMLPYLRNRPIVMTRYPDGIDGTSFFQRNAPDWVPDWIETVLLWSEDSQREIAYFIVNDEDSLLYLVNLGTIVFHIWSSRISELERPDWCILDLDPKKAPFGDVITIAKHIQAICEEIELPVFAKTSGSSGLHLLIPLGGQMTHDQSRQLAELLARGVAAELPEIATVVRTPSKRKGKVYLDFLQNGRGQLLVAPFSMRAVPEASASAPLRPKEVNRRLTTSRAYTIETLSKRMRRFREDPMAPVLDLKPDLSRTLARLSDRMG